MGAITALTPMIKMLSYLSHGEEKEYGLSPP
jgi:hypothetical protein